MQKYIVFYMQKYIPKEYVTYNRITTHLKMYEKKDTHKQKKKENKQ